MSWRGEKHRHSLAARGIHTKMKAQGINKSEKTKIHNKVMNMFDSPDEIGLHCSWEAWLEEIYEKDLSAEEFEKQILEVYLDGLTAINNKSTPEEMENFGLELEDHQEWLNKSDHYKTNWDVNWDSMIGAIEWQNEKQNITIYATPYYSSSNDDYISLDIAIYFDINGKNIEYLDNSYIELPKNKYLTLDRYRDYLKPVLAEAESKVKLVNEIKDKLNVKNSQDLEFVFKRISPTTNNGKCILCGKGHIVGDCK